MLNAILIYIGSAVIFVWGIAHIAVIKSVVVGFGAITLDNRRIITMDWIAEGLTLIFIGVVVGLVTWLEGPQCYAARIINFTSAGMLVVMAVLSQMTGARTAALPMKLCPYVKTVVAILFFLGVVL